MTGDPIENEGVRLIWTDDFDTVHWNYTNSDYQGFYLFNVAPGTVNLEIYSEGYFELWVEDFVVEAEQTIWMNISLELLPSENSIVCGYITDDVTGVPLDDVSVYLQWYDDQGHTYYNWTDSNSLGFYSMKIAAGEVYLWIHKNNKYTWERTYRNDAIENKTSWINVSLQPIGIKAEIAKPLKAIYLNNKRLLPYYKTLIIGDIDIKVDAKDYWVGINNVEFYIDGELKANDTTLPYNYTWKKDRTRFFGHRHTIKIVAYDETGNSATDEIKVWRLL